MNVVTGENFTLISAGLKLAVFTARPVQDKPCPTVIVNHGGGGMDSFYEDLCFEMASLGWAGVAMTARGYYPSEGRQEYGKGEVTDNLNLLDYLRKQPWVDKERLGMFGYSRGGLDSLLAAEQTEDLKALVSWAAPVDMFEHFRLFPGLLRATVGGLPEEMPGEYYGRSPINFVDRLTCPVLLVHGEEDEVIPLWHTLALAREMKVLGKPCEVEIIPGEGHNFSFKGIEKAWSKTIDFLHDFLDKKGGEKGEVRG